MQTINQLPPISQPREKLQSCGVGSLSMYELICIILRTGCRGRNVTEVAEEVTSELQDFGPNLGRLKNIRGLGLVKATEVVAACALHGTLLASTATLVDEPQSIFEQMSDLIDDPREHFVAFFLTIRNSRICREIISVGTLTASLVHPREVFKPAIQANASKVVLAHTHPSGFSTPSTADLDVTSQLCQAGHLLHIEIIDHVICAKQSFTSLKAANPSCFMEGKLTFC